MTKLNLPLSFWMCYYILFHMVWRVITYGGMIFVNECLFFLLFSFLLSKVHNYSQFFFLISHFILLISYFIFIPSIELLFFFPFDYNFLYVLFFILILILFINFFFLTFLLKFFWLSISFSNKSFCCFIFFQFDPYFVVPFVWFFSSGVIFWYFIY